MEVKTTFDVAWSNSREQTEKIAEELSKSLKGGEVIALFGDLGVGKTVFVKGLAKGLNVKKRITSPTFVFLKSYPIKINSKPLTLHHLDLYRSASNADVQSLGLDELFSQNSIVVLEWAHRIHNDLPKKRIDVKIVMGNAEKRRVEIIRY